MVRIAPNLQSMDDARRHLEDVTGHLADIDSALEHAHELAAKLHRPG